MNECALTFTCENETLVGVLHRPGTGPARSVGVLVVVGGPQYRVGSHRQFVLMARAFAAAGYAVFRFDYRGMGDSTGAARTFERVDRDIKAAIDAFFASQPELRSVVIFGLCDAASAALMYCVSDARVRGLMLANPWVRTEAGASRAIVRHYYGRRFLQRSFWSKVFKGQFNAVSAVRELLSRLLASRGSAVAQANESEAFLPRMQRGFAGFRGPILLLMSDRDLTAREFDDLCISNSEWSRCIKSRNVERYDVADSDHTFSNRRALNDVCDRSIRWLGKFE